MIAPSTAPSHGLAPRRVVEVELESVWQWGFVERVSTGLANVRDFDRDEGMAFLEVATRSL